jgi:hypothetical protein
MTCDDPRDTIAHNGDSDGLPDAFALLMENERLHAVVVALKAEVTVLWSEATKYRDALERLVFGGADTVTTALSRSSDVPDTIRESCEDLAGLFGASRRLHAASGYDELIDAVRDVLVALIGAHEFAIFVVNTLDTDLSLVDSTGRALSFETCRLDAAVVERVVASGEIYLAEEPCHVRDGDLAVCIPIVWHDAVRGVVAIFCLDDSEHRLTDLDRNIFGLIGECVARVLGDGNSAWM